MANLDDLKNAMLTAFANADAALTEGATTAQAVADAFNAMKANGPLDPAKVQELIDLVTTDGQELVDRGHAINAVLAALIAQPAPQPEPQPEPQPAPEAGS